MRDDWQAELQRFQLHRAAQDGDLARVNQLIDRGYPLNRFDEIGKTPLHYAAGKGHRAVVERLIEAGADVNAHDERTMSNTPLSEVAGDCKYEMVKLLLDAGADPTIRGWMQLNAIDRARQRKDADARKIVRLLETAAKA